MKIAKTLTIMVSATMLTGVSLDALGQGLRLNRGNFSDPALNSGAANNYNGSAPVAPPVQMPPVQMPTYGNNVPANTMQPPANLPGSAPPRAQGGWVDAFATPVNQTPSFTQEATTVKVRPKSPDRPLDGGITARDLQLLRQHDVSIVVDRSLSMTTSDCPGVSSGGGWQKALGGLLAPQLGGININSGGVMSRWEFVQSQTFALARQTEQVFPRGVMLVLFSSHPRIFKNVDLRQMPAIFAQNGPWGSTHTEDALEAPISDYFRRRDASGGNVKPLVIAVISDGMPTRPEALQDLIIQTTRRMRNPNEIRITFLQIGTERKAFRQLNDLDSGLLTQGAKFDIVETKTFPEVVQQGLARALVDVIEKVSR